MNHNFYFFYESRHPFSNWYLREFTHLDIKYNCSEQFMMREKAMLFHDYEVADLIMVQTHPFNQKVLGREVRGFDDQVWRAAARDIMVPGLVSKFQQDEYSRTTLLETGNKILVEASPSDTLWGVGLGKNDPRILDQSQWRGDNWLGDVLMRARDVIRG